MREHWPELLWGVLALDNVVLMLAVPDWQTVPFHLVWVSLTVLYGFRLWGPRQTAAVLAAVVLVTGAAVGLTGSLTTQRLNELAEVPLMAVMFMVMVWHARRRHEALCQVRRAAERERDFVRDASHELRTPITVARGHAELIRTAHPGTQTARDADVVIEELGRLGRSSDRMLILASAEHPNFVILRPAELGELVRSAADRWGAIPDRLWTFVDGAHGRVLVDRERVDCAIDALIENALKATDAGDRITVQARTEGSHAVVTVADEGRGILPQHLDRIFDRFARPPDPHGRRNGGTGLGLPIVKAIVEAHRGTVSVSSEVDRGTTFELRFAGVVPADALRDEPAPYAGGART